VSIAIGTLTIESSDSAEKKENSPIKEQNDENKVFTAQLSKQPSISNNEII